MAINEIEISVDAHVCELTNPRIGAKVGGAQHLPGKRSAVPTDAHRFEPYTFLRPCGEVIQTEAVTRNCKAMEWVIEWPVVRGAGLGTM